jgi:LPS-assembly lipoprotein
MKILLAISLFLLTACGFQPLYETGGSSAVMQEQLAAVQVGPIADRLGQVMRNQLISRMNAAGNPDYTLDVSLAQSSETFGIRPDTAATQEQLTLIATMRLISLETGEPVLQDSLRARTSFDVVLSDYATVTQREDAANRLALELAERIHRRLALHFANLDDRQKNSQSAAPTP